MDKARHAETHKLALSIERHSTAQPCIQPSVGSSVSTSAAVSMEDLKVLEKSGSWVTELLVCTTETPGMHYVGVCECECESCFPVQCRVWVQALERGGGGREREKEGRGVVGS